MHSAALLFSLAALLHGFPVRLIEDFEDAAIRLVSYSDEDIDPDSWVLDTANTHNDSRFSLKLFGNTWKLESISPLDVDSGDVWEVAAFIEEVGEVQGFGLIDGTHTLLYAFAGTELLDPADWVTVYQGAFPLDTWNLYRLPVGQDWLTWFGYLPTITGIVFVNDRDTDPEAVVYFDDVADITDDLPVAPEVAVWFTAGRPEATGDGTWSVTVQFHSEVTDPDSPEHDYYWHFGDDSTSADPDPVHTYVVRDDHEYTVLLEVVDDTGLWGRAACRVAVDTGPTTFPFTMNFVGDVMLARRYELPGGIIDTLGVEGIFEPTLPFLGNAADVTVANLESPLTASGPRHPTKPIVFRGRPGNVAGLVHAGIDVVSLANNHVIDYGLEGMREMQAVLDSVGIRRSGAGANAAEAYRPLFLQERGVNLAFLAMCDRTGQYDNYQPYLDAGYDKPGFALIDSFHVAELIGEARAVADLVVLEMHSGDEYSPVPGDEPPGEGDEFYSSRALFPSPRDIAKRRHAVECGADLVVCHHPHVLQGFEVYEGKLIAHSLGDFTFDLDYPETYPTVILNVEVDGTGFSRYWLTPVHIDDYIPVRAKGGFGVHVLDYLARRSKELGCFVVVDRDSVTAEIVMDSTTLSPWVHPHADELGLREEGDYWVSDPLPLRRCGGISSVSSVTPARDWQFRLGREMVWFGNCEDEGATLWWLEHEDEYYDTASCTGARSLCHRRPEQADPLNTDFEERIVCYSDTGHYTLHAQIMTGNAAEAGVAARFFARRTSVYPIGTSDLGTEVSGTTDWGFYHREFVPEAGTGYLDVRLRSVGPDSGEGRAWFDDVGIIEWEEWRSLTDPVAVPQPNDLYWIQVRASEAVTSAALSYEETDYGPPSAVAGRAPGDLTLRSLQSHPNPARRVATIGYELPARTPVRLRIYNVLGQEVRTLVDGIQGRGAKTVSWDGRDNRGRHVGAGTYVCRLQAGTVEGTSKIVLAR